MNTFADKETKVLNFIEAVELQKQYLSEEDAFKQSSKYKLKVLDKCKSDAREICLGEIFVRLYKDSVPLNDDYKNAYMDDLENHFKNFMMKKCPKGIEFYVKEGLKRKSPFAKKVLEAVNDLVDNEYRNKELNIDDIDSDDLIFKSTDDIQKRLDIIDKDLNADEISQIVHDNVKKTALSEITRAKNEKERLKNLENELAANISIDTPEKVQEALELRGFTNTEYTPSLFESVMINRVNKITPLYESGNIQEVYTYGVLNDYGKDVDVSKCRFADIGELAFIESVKEYTAISLLNALKMESFNKYTLKDLSQMYAEERF